MVPIFPIAHDTYLSGPPLGRTMPPIKVRLTDSNGGTYGAGASGSGTPSSNALASDIKDFIQYHQYIAEGDSLKARAAQVSEDHINTGIGSLVITSRCYRSDLIFSMFSASVVPTWRSLLHRQRKNDDYTTRLPKGWKISATRSRHLF